MAASLIPQLFRLPEVSMATEEMSTSITSDTHVEVPEGWSLEANLWTSLTGGQRAGLTGLFATAIQLRRAASTYFAFVKDRFETLFSTEDRNAGLAPENPTMLTLTLKDSAATQWAGKLNELVAILGGARQDWFSGCAQAAAMSKQNIFDWYEKTITALETKAKTWEWELEMHDFTFPDIINKLAEESTTSIYIYTNALAATFPLGEQQLSIQRKLLYLIVDKRVSGAYLRQVYVTDSAVRSFLQSNRQGGPMV